MMHISEYLGDLIGLEYIIAKSDGYTQLKFYSLTGKGIVFIRGGGFKNKYIEWIKNPDNLFKVSMWVFGLAVTILLAILNIKK